MFSGEHPRQYQQSAFSTWMRVCTIALLSVSAMTFAIPREVFDPHIEPDDDVFCWAYNQFGSEDIHQEAHTPDNGTFRHEPVFRLRTLLHKTTENYYSTRAPPEH